MKFFISFGQGHAHRIDGFTYDCDSLMLVEAKDEMTARLGLNQLLKGKWSSLYHQLSSDTLRYFPRGVINVTRPVEIHLIREETKLVPLDKDKEP